MAEALDAGLDLGGLALCYVAIAILLLVAGVLDTVKRLVPNPHIPGLGHPLGFVQDTINAAASAVQDAYNGVQTAAAKFQRGLLDSLTLLIGIPLLVAVGIYDLFTLLLRHTLGPLIRSYIDTTTHTATQAAADVGTLSRALTNEIQKARDYADAQAADALRTAKIYAATNIAAAAKSLEDDIRTVAQQTANGIVSADLAAGGAIRSAIHDAVDGANFVTSGALPGDIADAIKSSGAVAKAIADAVPAVAGVSATQVGAIIHDALNPGGAIAAAIAAAIPHVSLPGGISADEVARDVSAGIQAALNPGGAIAQAIASALPGVGVPPVSVPTPSLGDLPATVAALGTTVAGIEAIRFIGNETCRGKVSQLCDTDGNALASLLGGLSAIALAFSLRDVVDTAEAILADVEPLVKAAA